MGILKKAVTPLVSKYERGANYELGNSLSSTGVANLFGTGGDSINVLEEYSGIAWKCIDVRADRLADQDLFVQRLVSNKWQEDKQHPFNLVLEGGDGQNDQSELLEAHEKSMCLFGESFWYFSKGETSRKPFAAYLLNPNNMTVMVAGQRVQGYVYQDGDIRLAFDLDEIAHFKIHDWRHPFRGTGPMQSAGWFIRSSRYTMTYLNNFMENNAIPAGVIVAKGAVDDTDWKLFKEQWSSNYGGTANAGKTGFVRGSDLEFVKTGMSLGEVDYEKVKGSDKEDIMFMFGISKPMAAIFDDINRASSLTAKTLFAEQITSPALKRLERKFSKKVAMWYGPTWRVEGTNPIPEDQEHKIARLEKATNRWISVNEARIADGLEPLGPEYDVIAVGGTAPVAPTKSIGKVTIRSKVLKNNKASFNYEMKESFRSETEDIQLKYEQQFLQKANPILKAQKEMVLDQLSPKKIVDAHLDADAEARKLADETLSIFIGLAEEQGLLAAIFAGNADSTFTLTPVMEKYIADSVLQASLGFTKETQDKIATALAEGLQAGEGVAKIGKRINAIYDEVLGVETPGYRIERLTRTEIIKASNEVTEAAYRQSGVVQKKEWFANPGHCQFCASLNGSVIRLGATFVPINSSLEGTDGGIRVNDYEDVKHPPVHPSCRCTLIPVIEEIR